MSHLKHPSRDGLSALANEAHPELKRALRRWAEEQRLLRMGPKALLIHLADAADEKACVQVLVRQLQDLMNVSPRTISAYLCELKAGGLISAWGRPLRSPGGWRWSYRVAARDTEITRLVLNPPARLMPALDAFAPETLEEFREDFGEDAVKEYLIGSMVCPETDTLKPRSKEALEFFVFEALDFLLQCGVFVGEVLKTPTHG
ncbi:hypothetical protein [Phenylobacterium sp.]|uniref:hypothetical protein n=1 Tax=Phenylobacterium sp. TaxID=1871053 RepID=UPI0035B27642